jgi:hypothetical protein
VQLSLLAELKRRRVSRALVGYSILAFAFLQVIKPVMHGLHWPEAVLSYAVLALALGFPLVVTPAWIFDVRAGSDRALGLPADSRLKGARRAFLRSGSMSLPGPSLLRRQGWSKKAGKERNATNSTYRFDHVHHRFFAAGTRSARPRSGR